MFFCTNFACEKTEVFKFNVQDQINTFMRMAYKCLSW